MRYLILSITASLYLLAAGSASAQEVEGIVNRYTKVLEVDLCHNQVLVSDAHGLAVGDRVLLMQMKGASVDRTNTGSYGQVLGFGSAGQFEFATVSAVDTVGRPWVRFANRLLHPYDPSSYLQLIRVPHFTNVTLTRIAARPWDPVLGEGGVIAIEASGTMTVLGTVDARGCGFRGGAASLSSSEQNVLDYAVDYSSGRGAAKGESIAEVLRGAEAGFGGDANGGGGGNSLNGGGGGGGNGGSGGIGGNQVSSAGALANGGRGGRKLDAIDRVFMGGGGGGGHQNDGHGTDGGAGGGIVILRANTLTGDASILANGNAADTSVGDGAGGGGAGGTIILDAAKVTGAIVLQASGGSGGMARASVNGYCYAPGGGGGGGVLFSIKSPLPATVSVAPGGPGLVLGSHEPCNNTSYGATAGATGVTNLGGTLPESSAPMIFPSVGTPVYTICEGDTVLLGAEGGVRYTWQPAASLSDAHISNPKATPSVTTRYYVDIDNGSCIFHDSVLVIVAPRAVAQITGSITVCSGNVVWYHTPAIPGAWYAWSAVNGEIVSTNDKDSVAIRWIAGSGRLTLTVGSGNCSVSQTIDVTVESFVRPRIAGPTSLCLGDTALLDAGGGYASYTWSTGEETQTIRVAATGSYFVNVTSAGGCQGTSDSLQLIVNTPAQVVVHAPRTQLDSLGDSITLSIGNGFTALWSTGETGSSITVLQPGTYVVHAVDANGCSSTAEITITLASGRAYIELAIDDTSGAPGDFLRLPIRIRDARNVALGTAHVYEVDLAFNRSLLVLKEEPTRAHDSANVRFATFTIHTDTLTAGEILFAPIFRVTLGDTTATAVRLAALRAINGAPLDAVLHSGTFRLDNVCPAGGTRLYSESGALLFSAIAPNHAMGNVTLRYATPESGHVTIHIYDMLGRMVRTVLDAELPAGGYETTCTLQGLARGKYFVVYQTPTAMLRQTLEVAR